MKLFGKTVKINKRTGNQFSRGMYLTIVLTTRCNLRCDYCPMYVDGGVPKYKESTLDEWKTYIVRMPEWISLVNISGGEPSFSPILVDVVNYLLDTGRHVCIYTNLAKPESFYNIKNSYRLKIHASFHHNDSAERFTNAYNDLSKRFRIDVVELGTPKLLPYSTFKPIWPRQQMIDFYTFHAAPDSPRTNRIYQGCNNLYQDGK